MAPLHNPRRAPRASAPTIAHSATWLRFQPSPLAFVSPKSMPCLPHNRTTGGLSPPILLQVMWENVRVIPEGPRGQGEAVSVDGTHLGHNLPDHKGNRYCINLVSVAGHPPQESPS